MNVLGLAKGVAEVAVSLGTSAVVGNAIRASAASNTKVYQKVLIAIGGSVISGMVTEMAWNFVEKRIDSGVEAVQKVKTTIDQAQQAAAAQESPSGEPDAESDDTSKGQ